jgi:hypothetical protein
VQADRSLDAGGAVPCTVTRVTTAASWNAHAATFHDEPDHGLRGTLTGCGVRLVTASEGSISLDVVLGRHVLRAMDEPDERYLVAGLC